jgi:hypothetical protein
LHEYKKRHLEWAKTLNIPGTTGQISIKTDAPED